MIQNAELTKAVARIRQRAERQTDLHKLLHSYVDSGIITQINNQNHQILYGRRGTGKTHVFQVLRAAVEKEGAACAYIDCRTLGSTSQFSDPTIALPARCLALFRDIPLPVYDSLLEKIVNSSGPAPEKALEAADMLLAALTLPEKTYREEQVEIEHTTATEAGGAIGADLAKPSLRLDVNTSDKSGEAIKGKYAVSQVDKVAFPNLSQSLRRVIEFADIDIFILLDEWSSLPQDIQPFLAEFLKRGILPVQRATVKIASLEQRSVFIHKGNTITTGIEVGADVSVSQDLDDSYVFDRNPERITDLYSEIIFRHLQTELPDGYMETNFDIKSGRDLTSKLFTERKTFMELARAAEGVVRDLVCIFTSSYFHAQKRSRDTIDKVSVVEAARQWFEQDKTNSLDEKMQAVLRRLIDEVIGQRKARSFLVSRELSQHEMVQKLIDARVLHLMQRGYADKDNPGVRYNIYSLDYGTYVDLIGTSKQPDLDLQVRDDGDVVVPFDDKRSIRRIILRQDILEN